MSGHVYCLASCQNIQGQKLVVYCFLLRLRLVLSTAKGTTPTRVPGRLWESVEGPWEKVREEKGQAEWARRSAALPPPPPRCPAHSCLFLLALWPAQGARGAQGAGQGHGKEGKSRRRNQEEVCRWAQNLFFFSFIICHSYSWHSCLRG